jgi:amino acid permease
MGDWKHLWENAVAALEGKCCIKLKMLKTFKWAHNLSHIDWLCCVRMHRFYMARCFARNKCLTRCCFVQHMHASAAAILVCVYVCVCNILNALFKLLSSCRAFVCVCMCIFIYCVNVADLGLFYSLSPRRLTNTCLDVLLINYWGCCCCSCWI